MSVYKIKDQLRKSVESKQPTVHFYCETCQIEIPAGENRCQHCDESSVLEYHNLDVEQQIKDLFKDEHFCKLVMKETESSKDGQLADIRDGSEYRKLLCDQSDFQPSNTVQLSFLLNTDGVAVYSSSKKGSLWPVYLAINELPIALRFSRRYLLPCLLFCQSEKPNMQTYLASLMQTLDRFQKGIEIDTFLGKKFVKGLLLAVCVDLPARAMVLNMKQFNGKYGCNVCHAEGETQPNCPLHRYYPVGESSQRTHKSMVNDVRTAVQSGQAVRGMKGGSALLALKHVDLSKICPIDWMHCVLLGVVKALLKLWLCPSHKNRSFYIGDKIALMDRRLLHIQVPDFIARQPSSIAEHAHWKATECREWLIHFSIPVLRGLLKYPVSVHYFLLVYAMSLLTKEVVTVEDISVAEDMLTDFCTVFPDIYGELVMLLSLIANHFQSKIMEICII
ncbi:uncharacterized protein LOC125377412 [Haliotis rufescens]|uniref:uncharacterized protein LOC125377412 n=1 Tax=Haliotis rufescens TaxID=6454 RepID=UPI00201F0CAC|nr:uncharacterized protein LOC125377412 [Haliotis rufescens]